MGVRIAIYEGIYVLKDQYTFMPLKSNTLVHVTFGTEPFVAATTLDQGIPDHAIQIEGRLIQVGHKNLAGWGVTNDATKQIMDGIAGVPIRACSSKDAHACDYAYDTKSHIGYGVKAWPEDGWIMAAAAITDRDAVKHIRDGTWTPLGAGGWSVAGLPTSQDPDFETTGLVSGYQPTGISLVFAPSTPAFVGSGFELVVAAVQNSNHRNGDNMTEESTGGTDPVVYTQEALDIKVKAALEAKAAEIEAAGQTNMAEELAKQKVAYDAQLEALSAEDKATYEAKLTEMTPTADVEKMIAAAVTQGKVDTLETIEKDRLTTEYRGLLTASVVLGAPYTTDGEIDSAKVDAKISAMQEMKVATINSMVEEGKLMVAASTPAQSAFNAATVSGQSPGGVDQEAAELAICDRMG